MATREIALEQAQSAIRLSRRRGRITPRASLDDAPRLYATFRDEQEGCVKVVLKPGGGH